MHALPGLAGKSGENGHDQGIQGFHRQGNVKDMAVGVIIGAAFTAIVGSLVADLINPIVNLFLGGVDFAGQYVLLGQGEYGSISVAEEAGAAVFAWGRFVKAVINFLIIAFVVFVLVKSVNRARGVALRPQRETPPEPAGPTELDLLIEIRDALKK